jgi:Flp pilus assembly pilin Flp
MPLTLTVALVALAVIAVVGVVGTLIDNSEEKVEHPDDV